MRFPCALESRGGGTVRVHLETMPEVDVAFSILHFPSAAAHAAEEVVAKTALTALQNAFSPHARERALGRGGGDAQGDGCLAFITVNGKPVCVAAVAGPGARGLHSH